MKKRNSLLCLLMLVSLTSCSVRKNTEVNTPPANTYSDETQIPKSETQTAGSLTQTPTSSHKVLVAYFSRVGNTDFPKNVDAVASASLNVTKDVLRGILRLLRELLRRQ